MLLVASFFVNAYPRNIKHPEFNGLFYPDKASELNKFIDNVLKETIAPAAVREVIGILVPHAGYVYSGKIAAAAYKTVEGRQFDTVVIISSAHQHYLEGVAVYPEGEFETPLGNLEIDHESAETINSLDFSAADTRYFLREHPIEVQLPFIIKTIKNPKILPIIIGKTSLKNLKDLAGELYKISQRKQILIISSSDLSHFHTYDEAVAMDRRQLILLRIRISTTSGHPKSTRRILPAEYTR
jgi:hypothetical protein